MQIVCPIAPSTNRLMWTPSLPFSPCPVSIFLNIWLSIIVFDISVLEVYEVLYLKQINIHIFLRISCTPNCNTPEVKKKCAHNSQEYLHTKPKCFLISLISSSGSVSLLFGDADCGELCPKLTFKSAVWQQRGSYWHETTPEVDILLPNFINFGALYMHQRQRAIGGMYCKFGDRHPAKQHWFHIGPWMSANIQRATIKEHLDVRRSSAHIRRMYYGRP